MCTIIHSISLHWNWQHPFSVNDSAHSAIKMSLSTFKCIHIQQLAAWSQGRWAPLHFLWDVHSMWSSQNAGRIHVTSVARLKPCYTKSRGRISLRTSAPLGLILHKHLKSIFQNIQQNISLNHIWYCTLKYNIDFSLHLPYCVNW